MSVDATRQDAQPAAARRATPLLEVRDLVKEFPIKGSYLVTRKLGAVHAVDGVSFDVKRGETFGLVGESRLRQVDHRAAAAPAARADVGLGHVRRPRDRRPRARRSSSRCGARCR